eukprot:6542528-Pyramimonas_sp.AAC.1
MSFPDILRSKAPHIAPRTAPVSASYSTAGNDNLDGQKKTILETSHILLNATQVATCIPMADGSS